MGRPSRRESASPAAYSRLGRRNNAHLERVTLALWAGASPLPTVDIFSSFHFSGGMALACIALLSLLPFPSCRTLRRRAASSSRYRACSAAPTWLFARDCISRWCGAWRDGVTKGGVVSRVEGRCVAAGAHLVNVWMERRRRGSSAALPYLNVVRLMQLLPDMAAATFFRVCLSGVLSAGAAT
jgi:hypothetical protein